jgi:PAS domain S-box-containing protein
MRVVGARDPRFPNDADRLARLAAFPEQNPNPVVELDDRGLVYANPAALDLFPDLPESGGEHPLISGSRRIASELRRADAGSGSGEVELGEACYHLDVQLVPETGGLRAYAADVTQHREAERLVVESERRFRQLFDHSVEAIFLHDPRGRIVDCSAEACLSLGYSRRELLSLSVEEFATGVLSQEERSQRDDTPWSRALRAGPEAQVAFHENVHRRKDGSTFPVEVGIGAMDYGESRLVLASARDISERKLLEEALVYRATHDPLTGLPNRELLDSRLEHALARAAQRGEGIAALFLHLGGLYRARERLGYRAGDRL